MNAQPPRWIHRLENYERACAGLGTAVDVFGSRATGRARPNSDIDLVLYGPVPEAMLARLHQRFEDSLLPVSVDLLIYERIADPALKAEIDRFARMLFEPAPPGPQPTHAAPNET